MTVQEVAEWQSAIVCSDNLEVLRRTPADSIALIYIDPPFNTRTDRRLQSIALGSGESTRRGFGGKTYKFRVVSDRTWNDNMNLDEYLEFMWVRLVEMRRVLKADGSLYVHVDWRVAHYIRLLLDELFGYDHFLNEIIWSYDYGGRARDRWARKHDNIYWYGKGSTWVFHRDEIDRIPYMAPDLVGPEKAARGKLPTDVWWMTIVPTNSRERTGYPTQKPLKLLERIVRASSDPGDIVGDYFGGSGTTAVACARLGRRFVLVDSNPEAVAIARQRVSLVTSGVVRHQLP